MKRFWQQQNSSVSFQLRTLSSNYKQVVNMRHDCCIAISTPSTILYLSTQITAKYIYSLKATLTDCNATKWLTLLSETIPYQATEDASPCEQFYINLKYKHRRKIIIVTSSGKKKLYETAAIQLWFTGDREHGADANQFILIVPAGHCCSKTAMSVGYTVFRRHQNGQLCKLF